MILKKIILLISLLILMPCIVLADVNEESVTTSDSEITESPDTGISDYFILLGSIFVILIIGVEILNKKTIFKELN